jgi:hypothetical protein
MHAFLRHSLIATTLAVAGLASGNADAGGRDELKAFTSGLKGLEGQFSQQVFDARGKVKETSSGKSRCRRRAFSAGNTCVRIRS